MMGTEQLTCICCGHNELQQIDVLWKALTDAWRLSEHEIAYVNRQQGRHCARCKTNLRAMALAQAYMNFRGFRGTFEEFLVAPSEQSLKILELNKAGNLHQFLCTHPGHTLGEFPEVDMTDLPYPDASFDIVIHSDTLEHVEYPVRGLQECRRVLKDGGGGSLPFL
jgi:SAM-dependent methyltransferase